MLRRAEQEKRLHSEPSSPVQQLTLQRGASSGCEAVDLFIKGIQYELLKPTEILSGDRDIGFDEGEGIEGRLFNLERLHDLICGVSLADPQSAN